MKSTRAVFALALSFSALLGAANGQGLLSIGQNNDDFEQDDIPLTWTLTGNLGWDSNINSSKNNEEDSVYVQAGIGAQWSGGSRITRYTLGASASVLYYFEEVTVSNKENWFYSARLQGSVAHQASRRLTFTDSFYLTYEYEPDQYIGAATSSRTDQYSYFYNNAAITYAWTRRFSTVANYAFTGISYDNSNADDRYTHMLGIQGRYAWTRQTVFAGEYRFAITEYDSGAYDYTSNYVLVGVDHAFDEHTRGSVRVGAEFRSYDTAALSDSTNPYVEASLFQELNEGFSLRWMVRYGLEDGELGFGGYNERDSLRMGVTASYEFNPRTIGTAGISYVHSQYSGSGLSDQNEDYFGLNLGLSYLLYSNVRLNTGYSFSDLSSDLGGGFRDYNRHRVWMGVQATF